MGGSNSSATAMQQQQAAQQLALAQGGQNIERAFSGFNPAFYQSVVSDYEKQALPQLGDQYRQSQQQLNSKLADSGLRKSSAAQQAQGSLQKTLATGQQAVVNQAQQAAQDVQTRVSNQKAALYNQLQVSQNPSQVGTAAINAAAQTATPSTFAPIGQMFNSWANTYLAGKAATTAASVNPNLSYINLPQSGGSSGNNGFLGSLQ